MNREGPPRKVALIAGPTASGKSALAVALGRRVPAVVINADSAQVYADLAILSARPSAEDMAGVPHELFGHRDGAHAYSAAQWARDARAAIEEAWEQGRLPILAGGTGLYLRTLLEGIAPVPDIDPDIRRAVRALAVADAAAALAREDPAAAARLAPGDTTRIARALEVVRSTGRPLAAWQAERIGGLGDAIDLVPLILLPPRDWLVERIERRFEAMLARGAIGEVEALLARGLDEALPVMRAIGVREIAAFVRGEIDYSRLREVGTTATRRYGKRQYTWFRHQAPAAWPRMAGPLDETSLDKCVIKFHRSVLTG